MLPRQLYISRQRGFMCWGGRVFLRTVLQVSYSIIHACTYYALYLPILLWAVFFIYITVFSTWLLSEYHLFLASSSLLRVVCVCGRSSSVLVFMAAFCVLAMIHVCGGVCGCVCTCLDEHAAAHRQRVHWLLQRTRMKRVKMAVTSARMEWVN